MPLQPIENTIGTNDACQIPVIISTRSPERPSRGRCSSNLKEIPVSYNRAYLPIVLCTNTRSARYKLSDLSVSANYNQADIVCAVETWFDNSMDDSCFALGTNFSAVIRHDRQNRIGGGVAAWFHHNLTFKHWQHLESSEFESLWFTVWSCKMPRKFSRIILGIIYHPPSNAEGHRNLCNHIINCVDHIKRHHPYSGVMLVGDFNQFPDRLLVPHLKVKQIIKAPTRGA